MINNNKDLHIEIYGGAGDVLAITPALSELKNMCPQRAIIIHCSSGPHMTLLRHNPNIDRFVKVKPESQWLKNHQTIGKITRLLRHRLGRKKRQHKIALSVGSEGTYTIYRKKMSLILADALNVKITNTQLEIHLTELELKQGKNKIGSYTNPVIINPTIRSRAKHTWPLDRWRQLITLFPEHTFVQVGLPDEPLIDGAVDARGERENSLREFVAQMKFALAYVGMDTFWQHAAAAVGTPGVVLHGDGHPAVFGHDLHINLYKNRHCAPCMPRLRNSLCPYDVECITLISVNEVASALQQQLNNKQRAR